MKKLLALVVLATGTVLVACGGGGGGGGGGTHFKNPDSVTFTFADPAAPAGGSSEANAADAGVSGLSDAAAIRTQGDSDESLAESVTNLPNDMAAEAFGMDLPFSQSVNSAKAMVDRRAAAYLSGNVKAAVSGWDDDTCWSVTASQVKFDHCTQTVVEDAGTVVFSASGTLNRAAGHVWWDVTISIDETVTSGGASATLAASDRLRGDVTFGDTTIKGFERSDVSVAVKSSEESMSAAVTFNADLDLTYSDLCGSGITGGTLTLKEIWTTRPSSSDVSTVDRAVQFTWQDCGVVLVAWNI
jgi:hypothetical protein